MHSYFGGVLNIKTNLKNATLSIIIALLILLSSIITINYTSFGYGISEIIFIVLIIYWNVKVS
jgi:hypothetical protein